MRNSGAARAYYDRGPQLLGRRYGDWQVVDAVGYYGDRHRVYVVACTRCHREEERPVYDLRRLPSCGCGRRVKALPPAIQGVLVDAWTRWEDDDRAWLAVRLHPQGLTQWQVGELMGITEGRVREIEAEALRKLREQVESGAIPAEIVAHALGREG